MFPRIRAFIFDKDGTLFDTEPVERAVTIRSLSALGFKYDDHLSHALLGLPVRSSIGVLQKHFGDSFPIDEYLSIRTEERARVPSEEIRLMKGAREVMELLKSNRIRIGLATSASTTTTKADLAALSILNEFESIVTIDDVVQGKPHPETYITAMNRLGLTSDHVVAVEDSEAGVQSALSAGLLTIQICGSKHSETTNAPSGKRLKRVDDLLALLGCIQKNLAAHT